MFMINSKTSEKVSTSETLVLFTGRNGVSASYDV